MSLRFILTALASSLRLRLSIAGNQWASNELRRTQSGHLRRASRHLSLQFPALANSPRLSSHVDAKQQTADDSHLIRHILRASLGSTRAPAPSSPPPNATATNAEQSTASQSPTPSNPPEHPGNVVGWSCSEHPEHEHGPQIKSWPEYNNNRRPVEWCGD